MDEEKLEEMTTAELHELSNEIKAELRERKGYYCRECDGFQQNFDTSDKGHDFDDYKDKFGGLCQSCFREQTQLAALNRISEQLIGERVCGVEHENGSSTRTAIMLSCGVELYQGVPTQVVDDYPYLFDVDTEEIEERVRAGEFDQNSGDSSER